MAHVNGIAGAGVTEATRLAQTLLHRDAEAAALVTAGARADRAHAERLPESAEGNGIGDPRTGGRSPGDDARRRRREEDEETGPDALAPTGHLIDVQA